MVHSVSLHQGCVQKQMTKHEMYLPLGDMVGLPHCCRSVKIHAKICCSEEWMCKWGNVISVNTGLLVVHAAVYLSIPLNVQK